MEKVKEKRGTIRVEKYFQFLAISSNDDGGTKAFIHYYDDPKGKLSYFSNFREICVVFFDFLFFLIF